MAGVKESIKYKKTFVSKSRVFRKRVREDSDSEDETLKNTKINDSNDQNMGSNNLLNSGNRSDDVIVSYKSNKTCNPLGPSDQGATRHLDTETSKDSYGLDEKCEQDGRIRKYVVTSSRSANKSNKLTSFRSRNYLARPTNIRTTCQWDYQPDICKDYKETGYCGFGDNCKFLHDRTDYKYGWELEQENNEKEPLTNEDRKYEVNTSDEIEDLPFRCYICRGSFVNPVVTKCDHYFCEKCALNQYKKSTRCFVCSKQTNGIFNRATKIITKLKNTPT